MSAVVSVCCCFPIQLSCLCHPIQILPQRTYPVENVSVWGHIYLAIYFLALGFCFVRSCRHHQAGSQCLYWVGVRGRHKQNQPSCALKKSGWNYIHISCQKNKMCLGGGWEVGAVGGGVENWQNCSPFPWPPA